MLTWSYRRARQHVSWRRGCWRGCKNAQPSGENHTRTHNKSCQFYFCTSQKNDTLPKTSYRFSMSELEIWEIRSVCENLGHFQTWDMYYCWLHQSLKWQHSVILTSVTFTLVFLMVSVRHTHSRDGESYRKTDICRTHSWTVHQLSIMHNQAIIMKK